MQLMEKRQRPCQMRFFSSFRRNLSIWRLGLQSNKLCFSQFATGFVKSIDEWVRDIFTSQCFSEEGKGGFVSFFREHIRYVY